MTFLALTVTPDHSRLVVTQDMGIVASKARDTLPTGDAYVPAGQGAAPIAPTELRGKVLLNGGVVYAALGAYGALAGLVEVTRDHPNLDDAVEATKALPALLSLHHVPPSIVFLAGHSARLGRLAAFMLSAPLYEPVEVPPGHTLHPPPCTDLDSYDRIHDLWAPAAHGEATEAFHELVAINVRTAWRERRLREPVAFGGDLQCVTMSKAGIVEREAKGFWGVTVSVD